MVRGNVRKGYNMGCNVFNNKEEMKSLMEMMKHLYEYQRTENYLVWKTTFHMSWDEWKNEKPKKNFEIPDEIWEIEV